MASIPFYQSTFPSLFDDHAHLRGMLNEVRVALTDRRLPTSDVAAIFAELTETVLDHFQREEEGGYFSEALELVPQISEQVDALLGEHPALAALLIDLQTYAASGDESESWWRELNEMFERFLRQFRRHEQAEDDLLLQVYEQDLGEQD